MLTTGLSGLCVMGADAQAARSRLIHLVQDGTVPTNSRYRELVVSTLVAVGASDTQIVDDIDWASADDNPDAIRNGITREIGRAREKRDCWAPY